MKLTDNERVTESITHRMLYNSFFDLRNIVPMNIFQPQFFYTNSLVLI